VILELTTNREQGHGGFMPMYCIGWHRLTTRNSSLPFLELDFSWTTPSGLGNSMYRTHEHLLKWSGVFGITAAAANNFCKPNTSDTFEQLQSAVVAISICWLEILNLEFFSAGESLLELLRGETGINIEPKEDVPSFDFPSAWTFCDWLSGTYEIW
jgi:hypothetical protein